MTRKKNETCVKLFGRSSLWMHSSDGAGPAGLYFRGVHHWTDGTGSGGGADTGSEPSSAVTFPLFILGPSLRYNITFESDSNSFVMDWRRHRACTSFRHRLLNSTGHKMLGSKRIRKLHCVKWWKKSRHTEEWRQRFILVVYTLEIRIRVLWISSLTHL